MYFTKSQLYELLLSFLKFNKCILENRKLHQIPDPNIFKDFLRWSFLQHQIDMKFLLNLIRTPKM